MIALTDRTGIEKCQALLRQVTVEEKVGEHTLATDFNVHRVRERGWKVVPVESVARLAADDIPRLVSVLRQASSGECLVVVTEDLGELPSCYALSVTDEDFRELNRTLGLFRFLIADAGGLWAISCNEWYNLFAANPELLERMLGKPIHEARAAFVQFASAVGPSDGNRLLAVAGRYAAV